MSAHILFLNVSLSPSSPFLDDLTLGFMVSSVISLLLVVAFMQAVLFHQPALCLGAHALGGPPLDRLVCNSLGGKESTWPMNVPAQNLYSLYRAYFLGLGQPFL